MQKLTLLVLAAMFLTISILGCNATRGAGKDIENAGKHIENVGN